MNSLYEKELRLDKKYIFERAFLYKINWGGKNG